ncbi:hypothetical protein G7Z17_g1087 [Cylindrodendrum hubeiense]|uniref:CHAT domain-containing protein n=1 Tax=Cylindrodendrum hubeiense TaxID=595255 RepID=A0A9P5HFC5_9HYPO|nr:hypothetical protein G7Z17_g1087 [Cylindrodendrum hubeiense]
MAKKPLNTHDATVNGLRGPFAPRRGANPLKAGYTGLVSGTSRRGCNATRIPGHQSTDHTYECTLAIVCTTSKATIRQLVQLPRNLARTALPTCQLHLQRASAQRPPAIDHPSTIRESFMESALVRALRSAVDTVQPPGRGVHCHAVSHRRNSASIEEMALRLVEDANDMCRRPGSPGRMHIIERIVKTCRNVIRNGVNPAEIGPDAQPHISLLAALHARFLVSGGDIRYLDKEIQFFPYVLSKTKGSHVIACVHRHWSRALDERAQLSFELKDVDAAITQSLKYAELCEAGRERGVAHQEHAQLLDRRYTIAKLFEDLAASADALQKAADELVEPSHLWLWIDVNDNRTTKLGRYWESTRSLRAVREAKALNTLITATARESRAGFMMPKLLLHGGMIRKTLSYADHTAENLEEAIKLHCEGLGNYTEWKKGPPKGRKPPPMLPLVAREELEKATRVELASCYMNRFLFVSGPQADVDLAMEYTRQIPGPEGTHELSLSLSVRYDHFGKVTDLEEATMTAIDAVRRTTTKHEDYSRRLWWVAKMLTDGYWGSQRKPSYWMVARRRKVRKFRMRLANTRSAAIQCYQSASGRRLHKLAKQIRWRSRSCLKTALYLCKTALVMSGANVTRICATLLAARIYSSVGAWAKAFAHFAQTFGYLLCLDVQYLEWPDRRSIVDAINETCGLAACAMLRTGQAPANAVKLLDVARGIVVNLLLDTKAISYIEQLEAYDEPLFRDYAMLQTQRASTPMVRTAAVPRLDTMQLPELEPYVDQMSLLQRRLRIIPGFREFQRQLSDVDIISAAKEGPIVCFTLSKAGGHFLVITKRGIRNGEIAGLTEEMVEKYAQNLNARKGIVEMLRSLGRYLVRPLEEEYRREREGSQPGDPLPRVWWHMSGALSRLPLHAAGPLRVACDTDATGKVEGRGQAIPKKVMGLAVSSYLPSIRHLIEARIRRRANLPAKDQRKVLLVLMPWTAGYPDLDVVGQAESIRAILAAARWPAATILVCPSKAEVLQVISGVHFAIFACHAVADPIDPARGGVLLCPGPDGAPERLTGRDLETVDLSAARLACLFTCSNAASKSRPKSGGESPAAVFQMAGFQEVTATLYPAIDAVANRVCTRFFKKVVEAENVASYARLFHSAVSKARRETTITGWSSFIHVGI